MPPPAGAVTLESFDLSENGLTPDAMAMVTALPGLAQLARLNLGHNEVGNTGAAVLAAWKAATALRVLRLTNNCIGDDEGNGRSPYFINSPNSTSATTRSTIAEGMNS